MSANTHLYEESQADHVILDPGSGGVVKATQSGVLSLLTSVAATRTINAPVFIGQRLYVSAAVALTGNQLTFPATINAAANTILADAAATDIAHLVGVKVGTALKWKLVAYPGFTLA